MTDAIPYWRNADGSSDWDIVRIGGAYVPGDVDVEISPTRDIVEEKPKGEDGPTQEDNGYLGADVSIVIRIGAGKNRAARIADLRTLAALIAAWLPRTPGGVSTPLELACPQATFANVTKIRISGYTVSKPKNGILTIPIKAREWLPPGSQKPTQSSSQAKSGNGTGTSGDGGPLDGFDVPDPDPENLGGDFP